jgi:hypothetical protein
VENKLHLFHSRFFNINNTKLLLADHKKMIEHKKIDEYISNNKPKKIITSNNCHNNNKSETKSNFHRTYRNYNNTTIKLNYNKLKEIYNKSLYANKSLDNYYINNNNDNYNFEQKKRKRKTPKSRFTFNKLSKNKYNVR